MKHVCNREELKNKMLAVEQLVATGKSTEDACDICKIKIAVYLQQKNIYEAVKYYLETNTTINNVARMYKINNKSIFRRLHELGIKTKEYKNCNENIFDVIDTEEKAYWLGFLYADGCVSTKGNSIQINISTKDIEHLEKFKSFIGSTNKINIHRTHEFGSKKPQNFMCSLNVQNKHMHESLIKNGCIPRKSLILKFPNIQIFKSDDLIRHFLRGYCDGDGSFGYYPRHKNQSFKQMNTSLNLVGTKDFLYNVQTYLGKGLLIRKANCCEKTFRLNYSGTRAEYAINLMYSNSTISLQRKQLIYDEVIGPRYMSRTCK